MTQKTLDKWPGSPGIHAIAHQLGIPAATLAQLRAGTMVVVRRDLLDAMNAVCNGALESSIKRRKPRDMNARLDAWLVEEQAMLAAAQEPPRDDR